LGQKKGSLKIGQDYLNLTSLAKYVKIENPNITLNSSNVEDALNNLAIKLRSLFETAPEDLNTFDKIAAAINNDANFYTNIEQKIEDAKISVYTLNYPEHENITTFKNGDILILTKDNVVNVYLCIDYTKIDFNEKFLLVNFEEYCRDIILGLRGNPPDDLDTIEKLATSINNDPNFYESIKNLIDIKSTGTSSNSINFYEIYNEQDYKKFTYNNGDFFILYNTANFSFYYNDPTASDTADFDTRFKLVTDATEISNCLNDIYNIPYVETTDEALGYLSDEYPYVMMGKKEILKVFICRNKNKFVFNDIFVVLRDEIDINNKIDDKVSEVVGAAPENLNTLQELSDALNNDNDFANTVLNKISTKSSIVISEVLPDILDRDENTIYFKILT
jgi:hypothetical protein